MGDHPNDTTVYCNKWKIMKDSESLRIFLGTMIWF